MDDAKFARLWRDSRDTLKPRSAWEVKRELIAKGVDSSLAGEVVGDVDDEQNAYRAGLQQAQKLDRADFATFHRRLWGYLRRRGFSDSVCRHTINRLWEETDSPSHHLRDQGL